MPRHRNASRGLAKPFPRSAGRYCSVAPYCCAVLRRRCVLHFKAPAHQVAALRGCAVALLRPATPSPIQSRPRLAFATLCSAKQRLRSPYQSIAVACRGFASPLPCIALLCVAVPSLLAARPDRATQCLCASVRCRSFAETSVSLLLLRRSLLSCALPPPINATQSLRIPLMALLILRHALPRSAYPSPFPRRSRLSRAFPSHPRADQSVSFAEPRSAFPSQPSA